MKFRILITGATGFIGQNMYESLMKIDDFDLICFSSNFDLEIFKKELSKCDIILHLAGQTRTFDKIQFEIANVEFTKNIVHILENSGNMVPIIFPSSYHVIGDSEYGLTKLKAEEIIYSYHLRNKIPVLIQRLNNVFGPLSKPNYSSVVANFCYNSVKGLEHNVIDSKKSLGFIYIDFIVSDYLNYIRQWAENRCFSLVDINRNSVFVTIGELSTLIKKISRGDHFDGEVDSNFYKNLSITYEYFLKNM